jgi:hypothetical protein
MQGAYHNILSRQGNSYFAGKKDKVIAAVKSEVIQTFGRQVLTSGDCIELGDDIYTRTKLRISQNTMRRFFGLVKSPYNPSKNTLQILALYCGFKSIEEISLPEDTNSKEREAEFYKLITNFLLPFFSETTTPDRPNETFMLFIRQMILLSNRDKAIALQLQSKIARTKSGQEIYFERFINIDRLNDYYSDGLRYYANEKNTKDARLFYHSLQVFRYWLTSENELLDAHAEDITILEKDQSGNAYLNGRYFASILFYNHIHNQPAEEFLVELHDLQSHLENNERKELYFSFEYIIAEALILTGYYQEAMYFISEAEKKFNAEANESSIQTLLIFKGIALSKTGYQKKAEKIMEHIQTNKFSFLSKKYNMMLFLQLIMLLKSFGHYNEQINQLIKETGFIRLKKLS